MVQYVLKAHLHTHRGAQRDNCVGGSPKNSLQPAVCIPGAISPSKAFLISQRSLGAQRQVGTELRISEEGTLCLLGLSQGCPRGVPALVARHEIHPDEVNTRAPQEWEELLPGEWDACGLGCPSVGCRGPGESQPAVLLCVMVCTTNLTLGLWAWGLKCPGAWSWWDWDLGAAVGQTELLSPAAGGMGTDVCVCAFSPVHLCAVQPQGRGGWGSWCCVSALSVGPCCLCCQLCVSVYTGYKCTLCCLSWRRTLLKAQCWSPGTELPQPHLPWAVTPCTICCIKSRVSLGEMYKEGWYLVL